jgi:glycosyltransferase involved in cell wall biosynthesis
LITVLCPTYNESEYIEKILKFFINAKPPEKELLIIDGGSNDGTKDILNEWTNKYNNIHLLENENKYVPFALNIGIKNSSGDPIIRLDAHTEYAGDYFEQIIKTFNETKADIVGGPMNAVGKTNFQIAVAQATSNVFGVGDSKIHKGRHYRARSLGKMIFLNHEIKSFYYPRDSISKLIRQYFQYGLFKPMVLRKIKSEIKLRHLIPSLFSIYILLLVLAFLSKFYLLPLFVYIFIDIYFSIRVKCNIKIMINSLLIYPVLHLSYGFGFLSGLFRAVVRN